MWFVVAASAVGAALAGAHPTGWRPADVALSAALAALVSLSAAYARRWSWLVGAGVAVVASDGGAGTACAVAAVLIGFTAVALNVRSLAMGAAAGGLVVQALLRLPAFLFLGAPSLLVVVAIAPMLVSGYRYAPRRARRRVRRVALGLVIACAVLTALAGVVALLARAHIEDGLQRAQAGFDAIGEGERDTAVSELNQAAGAFGDAAGLAGAWWAAPIRALPIVGQQVHAVETLAREGRGLARSASKAAAVVDYEQLRLVGGAIDVSLLAEVKDPITETAAALDVTARELADLEVDWLLPPVRDRYDQFKDEVDRALPAAELARDVITVAPTVLGAEVPQHYLVLFGTPSETRELGGFVGNYAEITAQGGKLSLTRSGRGLELSDPSAEANFVLREGEYVEPFLPYRPTQFFGNVTSSANFLDVANVAAQLYPQATGQQVDGVFYMDPYSLAALLELTGPITLSETGTKLNSKNAAQLLLVDQYIDIVDDRGNKRADFLDEATRKTFERLTEGDLPKPARVAKVMSPMVDQGRLFGFSTNPDVEALFRTLELDGAVPAPADGDLLWVTQANQNPSKIDAYLQRDLTYEATVRPNTGQVEGLLKVQLTNRAPAEGLPEDVIGNANGQPFGTNHLFLTVYSPLRATSATLDGGPLSFGSVKRFGLSAYTIVVDVPPGGSVAIELRLSGEIEPSRSYQLTVVRQPTVNPDAIEIVVRGRDGFRSRPGKGFTTSGDAASQAVGENRVSVLEAAFDGP